MELRGARGTIGAMSTIRVPALGVRSEAASTALVVRELRRLLRGGRVESVSSAPDELVLSLGRRGAAVFRAEPADGAVRLCADRARESAAGPGVYPELAGWRILRVRDGADSVELHFGDVSTLELCAVVGHEGCRTATVRRRTQRDRRSSRVDRALGRLLQPRPPGSRGPRPSAGLGTY